MKKVALTVNAHPVQVVVDEKQAVLLDLVREDLGLTGTKQSCDRKGQCGTCMVLVNGKAVLSCITKVAALEGAEVTTIEGLGTPDRPNLVQQAFVLAGAVQCGFCIPGMIVTATELLEANPAPTRAEIRRALRRNLCRCTGYVKIIDAVQLAGRFLRGEIAPADLLPGPDAPPLGVSHPRPSALAKACGTAAFGADIRMPGALEIAVVRSPYAHAVIRAIDTAAAAAMPGVAGVMTAADIKGTNRIKYTVADRPILCDDKVRTLGDAVAIVAAETKEQALAAVDAVVVDYEPLPVLASPEAALADGAPQIHPDLPNLCYSQPIVKGDAASAFASAAAIVEGRFRTQINHQAPLEPEVSLAYLEGEGEDAELVVIGRSINIHLALASLQAALGWEAIRYEEAFSGGQFGIKVEVITEGIAAAAALHFRRPVRYVPSLAESMLATSKRHPFDMGIQPGGRRRGPADGAGHGHHRRQRRLHVARDRDPQPRPAHAHELLLRPQHSRHVAPRLHEQPVGQRGPRGRAAPDPLRARVRHRPAGREDGDRPARVPPAQLAAAGRDEGDRPRREGVAVPRPVRRDPAELRGGPAGGRGARRRWRPARRRAGGGRLRHRHARRQVDRRRRARSGRRRDGIRRRGRPGRGQRLDADPAGGVTSWSCRSRRSGSAPGALPTPRPRARRREAA